MSFARLFAFVFLSCASFLTCAASTVGTCQADRRSYSTITAAINAAESDGVIEVCPGIYPEQLIIKKSLTIRGIGTFTVANPAAGLPSLAASGNGGQGVYAPVFIDVPGGQVKISYMQTSGGSIALPDGSALPASITCQIGIIEEGNSESYVGIYSVDGFVSLDHVSTGFNLDPISGGGVSYPIYLPNCGNGIVFKGGTGIVTHSVVTFGYRGISGAQRVEHSTLTGGGLQSIGVLGGDVLDSTISGPGISSLDSTGVSSSRSQGNVIQNWKTGIKGGAARHNTLLNNAVGITGAVDLAENLVVAPSTYHNPACYQGVSCSDEVPSSPIPSYLPAVGIDMGCTDGTITRDNSIVGVGIAFANVDPHRSIPRTNLVANVSVISTACVQSK